MAMQQATMAMNSRVPATAGWCLVFAALSFLVVAATTAPYAETARFRPVLVIPANTGGRWT
jgi:hypothetical protein